MSKKNIEITFSMAGNNSGAKGLKKNTCKSTVAVRLPLSATVVLPQRALVGGQGPSAEGDGDGIMAEILNLTVVISALELLQCHFNKIRHFFRRASNYLDSQYVNSLSK